MKVLVTRPATQAAEWVVQLKAKGIDAAALPLIGISPATVLEVDFRLGRLLDHFQLSPYVNECIHGLEAAPSLDFPEELPPASPVA